MSRHAAAVMLALSLGMLATPSAQAAIPARNAAQVFATEATEVAVGDIVFIGCGTDANEGPSGTLFGVMVVTDTEGDVVASIPIVLYSYGWGDSYVTTQTNGDRHEYPISDGKPWPGLAYRGFPLEQGGTLRAAYATWALQDAGCAMFVNGEELPLTERADASAVFALNTDFSGPAAVSAQVCVASACPPVNAAAMVSYTRSSSGFLFAYLDPGFGATKSSIAGPAGQSYESLIPNGLLAAGETSGPWTYSIDAQATVSGGPALWIIEI